MLPPFDLSVPSDDRYRSLAPEAAAKYAELAGRPAADAQALGDQVREAATRMATPDQNIDVKLSATGDVVEAFLSCGGQTATLKSR